VEVTIKLTGAGKNAFSSILSGKCVDAASRGGVRAIALAADTSQTTVVLIPTPGICAAPTRISIPLSEGFATPVTSVTPAASPSAKASLKVGPRGLPNPKLLGASTPTCPLTWVFS
jgi:hypothetical protein